jgi:hypothetical protein
MQAQHSHPAAAPEAILTPFKIDAIKTPESEGKDLLSCR